MYNDAQAQVVLQLRHKDQFAGEAVVLVSFSPLTRLERAELLAGDGEDSDSEDGQGNEDLGMYVCLLLVLWLLSLR